jgi:hypothetical protein
LAQQDEGQKHDEDDLARKTKVHKIIPNNTAAFLKKEQDS